MRIHVMGRHAHRTPFAYAPYRAPLARRFTWVEDPAQADALVFAYVLNIDETAAQLAPLLKARPDLRLVVVSEEPLWDTTNSGDFRKRHNLRKTEAGEFRYSVINHHTSDIYAFGRLPYFLTTDDKFWLRYARAFARNAALRPKDLLAQWARAPIRHAFFAENRDLAKKYSVAWPEIATWGLSVYRTDVAKAMPDKDTLRVGQGWGTEATRQSLPDWHLDKIATLDTRAAIVSAIENTHQRDYISEKIFDAFAVRGIPLYWAAPGHRVRELAPEGSFLNLHDLKPKAAAARIAGFKPDAAFAEGYVAAQAALAERFRRVDDYIDERLAFAARLSDEMEAILRE